jgi:hypothetical protein
VTPGIANVGASSRLLPGSENNNYAGFQTDSSIAVLLKQRTIFIVANA